MFEMYKDEKPVTPELRAFRRKMLIMLPIFSVAFTVPILFFLEYGPQIPDKLLGVANLGKALQLSAIWLFLTLGAAIALPLVGTWINIRQSNLKHAIVGRVEKGLGVSLQYYDANCTNRSKFCQADDEKLLQLDILTFKVMILPIIVTLIPISIFLFNVWTGDVTGFDGAWISFSVLLILYLIYNFSFPKCRIEFNRLEGTVTVPSWCFPYHRTLKFDKLQVNAYEMALGPKFHLVIPYRFFNITLIGDYDQAQEWWSFYMWYMDKNRPLPTGTLLDAYREKDYLRRRAEGFPEPLYPATINTPEWKGAEEKYGDTEVKTRYKPQEEEVKTRKPFQRKYS